jgi:mRNA interferase MazF
MGQPSQGEIWFAALDPVVGHEQGGDRPALVLSVDMMNHGPSGLVIVAPGTTRRREVAGRVLVPRGHGSLLADTYFLCDQVRTVSVERLRRLVGSVDQRFVREVLAQYRFFLGI